MDNSYELHKSGKKVMKKYGSLSSDLSPKAFDSVLKHKVMQEVGKVAEKYEARVDAVYASHWGGVDIDGLNEDAMLAHWQRFNANARKPTAEFFKGSAFGWPGEKARTSHSFMARLLSVGLPPALKNSVSISVKTYWTAHDVQV